MSIGQIEVRFFKRTWYVYITCRCGLLRARSADAERDSLMDKQSHAILRQWHSLFTDHYSTITRDGTCFHPFVMSGKR